MRSICALQSTEPVRDDSTENLRSRICFFCERINATRQHVSRGGVAMSADITLYKQTTSASVEASSRTGAGASPSALNIISRIGAALLGGYAFTWGLCVLGITAGVAAGVAYDEAYTRMMLLAFFVYLGAFLWAFGGKRLAVIWAVLLGGGATMTGTAWMCQRVLSP
jgi:hypothetical protein